ncbi:MAG: protein kinase domain-containing protein [Planctomycetota bacterium]|jgi:hypothetical protein
MEDFRYKYGDRPLEGYTIQRAAGRGGFGEVYYAISDSGRQVALKAIQNYEQIELRGITQCMNLKSPHLVTIFDVKHNNQGRPFVIMEYVAGPSLRDLLKESPGGVGTQKAAFFLREIAKGLSFLHECGIVHRDLKPGNIFYENGYVKIGDYGLTKAIAASQHSGQTITVGTVHYMAPEIGAGCYDRSIDIYALGILLYEMLTGQVPFFGASPAEILMKHMTAEPELDQIEEPFARIIRKALAKDPADRYKTVQEMVEDVFGSEHVRNSVSHFSPESLSMAAERIAEKAKLKTPPPPPKRSPRTKDGADEFGRRIDKIGRRIDAVSDRIVNRFADKADAKQDKQAAAAAIEDPIDRRQRLTLATIAMTVVALGAGVLHGPGFWPAAILTFAMIGTCSKSILWARWRLLTSLESEAPWLRKLATGVFATICTAIAGTVVIQIVAGLGLFNMFPYDMHRAWIGVPRTRLLLYPGMGLWLALAIVLCLTDWWRMTSPRRSKRVSLAQALWLGLLGFFIAVMVFKASHAPPLLIASVLAGTSLVVQVSSPLGAVVAGGATARRKKQKPAKVAAYPAPSARPVPPWGRMLWLAGFVVLLGFGLMMLIWVGMENMGDDECALAVSFGLGSLIFALFCLVKSYARTFTSWYRYLIKPLILLLCAQSVLTACICLGMMNLHSDETLVGLFFVIFPGILFFVVFFTRSRTIEEMVGSFPVEPVNVNTAGKVSPFKRLWALVLSGGMLIAVNGLQRFYVGKIGTGILWLLTFGLFGIGQIMDVIMILVGQFKDRYGRPLLVWESENELDAAARAEEVPAGIRAQEPAAVPAGEGQDDQGADQHAEQSMSPLASSRQTMGTTAYLAFNPFSFLLTGVGYIFVLVAFLLGLAIALHLPAMVAAGLPDPDLAEELNEMFGFSGWPAMVERLGYGLAGIILLAGATLIIVARRRSGVVHIIRAALGISGLLLCLVAISKVVTAYHCSDPVITDLVNKDEFGLAVDRLLTHANEGAAVVAAIIFITSIIVLAWPPRRTQPQLPAAVQSQGVTT